MTWDGQDKRRKSWGRKERLLPGMLEVFLVMVAVEDREAEHAAGDLLSFLLQLGQVLLGIICKSTGGVR